MSIALGIDTGGTYTDAVLLDREHDTVVRKGKSPTTYQDLSLGIANALDSLGDFDPRAVAVVCLSTTLATNSIVEGKGFRVGLISIGYGPTGQMPADEVVLIRGGHNAEGEELRPLDEDALGAALARLRPLVDGYAVSAYFGVLNPEHELQAAQLIRERTGAPVVCGHELSPQLGMHERAATACLNVRLLPLVAELMTAVGSVLDARGIHGPLMVVRGDGSLVAEHLARQRPIETLLSGPAASVLGACRLTGVRDAVVVDMGGTTTDIAVVREGRAAVDPEGATVGGWQTRVRATNIHTCGLGGDSRIHLGPTGEVVVGPERVLPLCMLVAEHPGVLVQLEAVHQQQRAARAEPPLELLVLARAPDAASLTAGEQRLITALAQGPLSLYELSRRLRTHVALLDPARLEGRRAIVRAGLTPTDVLHYTGRLTVWHRRAADLGLHMLAVKAKRSPEALAAEVLEAVTQRLALAVLGKLVADRRGPHPVPGCEVCELLLSEAFFGEGGFDTDVSLALKLPLVGIGAPAGTYLPPAAERLRTALQVPEHSEVANAVGAASATIAMTAEGRVRPLSIDGFGAYGPDGMTRHAELEAAVAHAVQQTQEAATAQAAAAGARQVRVSVIEERRYGTAAAEFGGRLLLEVALRATAEGRPYA